MSFNGVIAGDTVVLTNSGGKPVVDSPKPDVPAGYRAIPSWQDTGLTIARTWTLQPVEGTAADAAIRLAQLQAATLTDTQALKVPALYPKWDGNSVAYSKGDRVLYSGQLYKVLQDHKSQADWTPDKAPSLFAKILPGQAGNKTDESGKPGKWVQPDSTNPYHKGDKVTHNGKTWVSNVDGNVWEPGATGVTQWDEAKD